MNLYAYLNINVPGSYKKNWKYYEKMCESSSSLTYPVHSICAIDNEEYDSFKKYINDSIRIDIDDLHGCAYQGVHAGCLAGGWYGIYRGVCGFEAHENYLKVNPHFNSFLHQIKYQFYYHHVKINVVMDTNCIKLTSSSKHKINLLFNDQIIEHHHQTIIYKNKKFNNS
jgi:trehalose/maltose hydrolase-like predicted phosphorylase